MDGTIIRGLIGVDALKARFDAFPIPQDLRGARVLDVGAATGWCSFELERRGAQVVATDCVAYEEFYEARRLLGSSVEYRILDIEEMTPDLLGRFDYVVCFGVLYHLRHPLLGLERICALTAREAFIESFVVSDDSGNSDEPPYLEFYERDELGGQIDNWFGPSLRCLEGLARAAGFARVASRYCSDRRAGILCSRFWRESLSDGPAYEAPWINAAVNNRTGAPTFHTGKDEYISLYFNTHEEGLTVSDVLVEIDGLAAPLITLTGLGRNGWQANMKTPPLLEKGTHSITVRTVRSDRSSVFRFDVVDGQRQADAHTDCSFLDPSIAVEPPPHLYEIENSLDESTVFRGYRSELLCCRFRMTRERLGKEHVEVRVGTEKADVRSLTLLWNGGWQANCTLRSNIPAGRSAVQVRTNLSSYSNELFLEFAPEHE